MTGARLQPPQGGVLCAATQLGPGILLVSDPEGGIVVYCRVDPDALIGVRRLSASPPSA